MYYPLRRKKSQVSSILSKLDHQSLFDNNPSPMWVYDLDTFKFLSVNDSAIHSYGYSREEFLLMTLNDIRPDEDIPILKANILINGQDIQKSTYWRHKKKDGSIIYVDILSHSLPSLEKIRARLVMALDVTERKLAKDDLKQREKEYRDLFENILVGIYRSTPEGKILKANPSFIKMMGYSTFEELSSIDLNNGIFPDESPRTKFIDLISQYGAVTNFESAVIRKNGSVIYILENAKAVKSETGEVLYFDGAIQDITEQKMMQMLIERNEKLLSESQTVAKLGHWEWNAKTKEVLWSDELYKIYGFDPGSVNPSFELFINSVHPDDKEFVQDSISNTINGLTFFSASFRLIKPDGSIGYYFSKGEAVLDDSGNLKRVFGVVQDITYLKLAEIELLKAKEKAEESDKLKSIFLSNISHELITPLIGLIGGAELLSEEFKNSSNYDLFTAIIAGGRRLSETFNSILDLSRIEANKFNIVFSPINVNEILNEVIKINKPIAVSKNLYLNLSHIHSTTYINGDKYLFFTVFNNLLNNAIKYTSAGGVNVKMELIDSFKLKISVIDTGLGIDSENYKFIFEPFRQISEGMTRKFEGPGIGLTIAKKFVELLNGNIHLESEPGKGSIFSVTFPIQK